MVKKVRHTVKPSDSDRDSLIEAVIRWNVPALRRQFTNESSHFRATLSLLPSVFDEGNASGSGDRGDDLLAVAADLLRDYALGRQVAVDRFDTLGRLRALDLLFRDLWLAWLDESDNGRLATAAERVRRSRISADLKAHCYSKLATWSWARGLAEQARTYVDAAYDLARDEFRILLDEQGSFFGRDIALYFERPDYPDLLAYPWIDEFSLDAASSGLEAPLKARARGSRSITLGGTGTPGQREIEAALLQADWAGAFWLLTGLFRIKAALLLEDIRDDSKLAEGLSLWVLGGGERPGPLIDSYEARFSSTTADEIIQHLRIGARIRDKEKWLAVCGVLWDEVSDEFAVQLIEELPLEAIFASEYPAGRNADALSLFAVLFIRDRQRWVDRFERLPAVLRGLTLRSMAPAVAELLPGAVLRDALGEVFADHEIEGQWKDMGWDTISASVVKVGAQKWTSLLRRQIPHAAVPTVALNHPGLLSDELINECLAEAEDTLGQVRADWERGAYSMYAHEPTINATRIVLAGGKRNEAILSALVHQSRAPGASPEQAALALWGLNILLRDGLAESDDVRAALPARKEMGPDFWDGKVNERVEDVRRATLAASADRTQLDRLVAATKDPSPRVRRIAVEAFLDLAVRGPSNEVSDGVLFAALYDPDDSVQIFGVQALTRGQIASQMWAQIGWARLLELWPEAHRRVRASLVSEVIGNAATTPQAADILALARADRSISVAMAARPRRRRAAI